MSTTPPEQPSGYDRPGAGPNVNLNLNALMPTPGNAELVVYLQAPGTVVRCRTCGSVLMVFVKAHGVTCTDLTGLASLSPTNEHR